MNGTNLNMHNLFMHNIYYLFAKQIENQERNGCFNIK